MPQTLTKLFFSVGSALLTTLIYGQTIPSAQPSEKQSFIDALAQYWGQPNTAENPSPPPPSSVALHGTFSTNLDMQKTIQKDFNITQSFVSFTGVNDNGVQLNVFNTPNPTSNTLALYRCLTANAMPNNPISPKNIQKKAIDIVEDTLRFTAPTTCAKRTHHGKVSDKAASLASAFRSVSFFHAATTQCIDSFGDPDHPKSAKDKATNNSTQTTNNKGKFAQNLQPCSKNDAYNLARNMRATLMNGRDGEGALPYNLKNSIGNITNTYALPKPDANSSPTTYKTFLVNAQGLLDRLSSQLSTALLIQLNQDASKQHMQSSDPEMLSTSSLVGHDTLKPSQASNAINWIQGIANSFSPEHYVAPGLIVADNTSSIFAFGRGQLLNITAIDDMKPSQQKQFYVHNINDSKHYVGPSPISNYRTSHIGTIKKKKQDYTTKIAQFGLLKNAALGSLSMLVAERYSDKKPSFIASLKANAMARSGDAYAKTLSQLKPVGLMREEVKLLADIRYQLYLNYLAQERVQASLAMVQLNNLHDSVASLNSEYNQLKEKIKKYNHGEGSGGVNTNDLQTNPTMSGS